MLVHHMLRRQLHLELGPVITFGAAGHRGARIARLAFVACLAHVARPAAVVGSKAGGAAAGRADAVGAAHCSRQGSSGSPAMAAEEGAFSLLVTHSHVQICARRDRSMTRQLAATEVLTAGLGGIRPDPACATILHLASEQAVDVLHAALPAAANPAAGCAQACGFNLPVAGLQLGTLTASDAGSSSRFTRP
jgi:hypothetical protein